MLQQSHDGVRLFSDAPVVDSFSAGGRTILALCRRDYHQAIQDMRLLIEIVPQKHTAFQGGNNAIAKSASCQHAAVAAGCAGGVGDALFGSEVGQ